MMSNKTSDSWWNTVKVGDMLKPDPFWNASVQNINIIDVPTEVLSIMDVQSQSGRLFQVKTKGGLMRWLDAKWFTGLSFQTKALRCY
jgi:hypothetical protein